jgi:hypothetical protein
VTPIPTTSSSGSTTDRCPEAVAIVTIAFESVLSCTTQYRFTDFEPVVSRGRRTGSQGEGRGRRKEMPGFKCRTTESGDEQ